jgi:hypothetical protein
VISRAQARQWAKLPAHFLNVDLDVHSSRPLDVLAQAMEKCGTYALHCERFHPGDYRAAFEVYKDGLDADGTIEALGRAVARLPAPARRLFDRATLRDFSIGIQAGKEPHAFELAVSTESLAIVSALRGRLSVTVYAPKTAKKLLWRPAADARKGKPR